MSRIGKAPVKIVQGAEASVNGDVLKVKGPKGELSRKVENGIEVEIKDGQIVFTNPAGKESDAYWGLYRALAANMMEGVTKGFKKDLEIIGVGYRAAKKGNGITINIGYSHPVEYEAPTGITLDVSENTKITVSGVDKDLVGLVAAKIREIRKPEPYKGKGIKYSTEVIRRKAGKAAGKTTA